MQEDIEMTEKQQFSDELHVTRQQRFSYNNVTHHYDSRTKLYKGLPLATMIFIASDSS